MGIDHGGSKVFMSEQALDGADVVVVFENMGGKAVTKGMGGDMFLDLGELDGAFKSFINCVGGEMMAAALDLRLFLSSLLQVPM